MYLSNAEKEALWLTGYGDVLPRVVEQALEQALANGTYIPGEEALRLRLADALDLEERLAAALLMEREAEEVAFAEGLQQGLVEGIEQERFEEDLVDAFVAGDEPAVDWEIEEATTEGQEAAKEPPADQWRSPLEIVTEGAEEAVALLPHLCSTCTKVFPECDAQDIFWSVDIDSSAEGADADKVVACDGYELKPPLEIPGEEDAAPAAVAQRIEDQDFSSFTKAQLLAFAADHFGVSLRLTALKDELIATVQGLVDEANEKVV